METLLIFSVYETLIIVSAYVIVPLLVLYCMQKSARRMEEELGDGLRLCGIQTGNHPFFFSNREIVRLSLKDRLQHYEPAYTDPGVVIPLAEPSPVVLPTNDEELTRLRQGLRYVWCDGYEDRWWKERSCKYLGIRISDSFILHESMCSTIYLSVDIDYFVNKCVARKLKFDELRLLSLVWDEVSTMRQTAEDCALPDKDRAQFWLESENDLKSGKVSFDIKGNSFKGYSACLLLAVKN